MPDLVVPINI